MGHHLRLAIRSLLAQPVFTASTLALIALGMGFGTIVVALVYSILLRPLPYAAPQELVAVWETDRKAGSTRGGVSHADFVDWLSATNAFSGLVANYPWKVAVTDQRHPPMRVVSAAVSPEFFPLLGSVPLLGRGLRRLDAQAGSERVVILGYRLWMSRFGGERQVLGETIFLDGQPYRIIGIMPRAFVSPVDEEEDCWIPMQEHWSVENRRQRSLVVIGRLKPGVSMRQADEEMRMIMLRLEQQHPEENAGRGARVEGLREAESDSVAPSLLVLLLAVGIFLLVVCMDLSHAMMARSLGRAREIAIRTALGASRLDMTFMFLLEALTLSVGGSFLGLILAAWGIKGVKALELMKLPRMDEVQLDWHIVAVMFAVATLMGFVSCFGPALQIARCDLSATLGAVKTRSGGLARQGAWKLLVASEVAAVTILAIGAGLLGKSFIRLNSTELGFESVNLSRVDLELSPLRYPYPEHYPKWPQVEQFYSEALEAIDSVPGVESAAISLFHPLEKGISVPVKIQRTEAGEEEQSGDVNFRPVSPTYFNTIQQSLIRGRYFNGGDSLGAPSVVIVNESFARQYFTFQDVLGRRVSVAGVTSEIVGVVRDSRTTRLGPGVVPTVYPALAQTPMSNFCILVRSRQQPADLASAIRQAIWKVDNSLPVPGLLSMEKVVDAELAKLRLSMVLMSAFAALALLLALFGIYGLLLYTVAQQSRELGIRLALGAQRAAILALVAGRAMLPVVWGIALGVGAALMVTRVMTSLLYGVSALDWQVFLSVTLGVISVGLLACSVPSLRTAKIDPAFSMQQQD